jgi:hypothetical protein
MIKLNVSNKRAELIGSDLKYYYEMMIDEEFDYIVFKNFYTHKIQICIFYDEWKNASEMILMNDPDCDEEGEKYFLISRKVLNELGRIRIYLEQKNDIWKEYYLTDFKIVKDDCSKYMPYTGLDIFQIENYVINLGKQDDCNYERLSINDNNDLKLHILK